MAEDSDDRAVVEAGVRRDAPRGTRRLARQEDGGVGPRVGEVIGEGDQQRDQQVVPEFGWPGRVCVGGGHVVGGGGSREKRREHLIGEFEGEGRRDVGWGRLNTGF